MEEENKTIYYGEKRDAITKVSHLRDIEISIINYILDDYKNYEELIPKLTDNNFTFGATYRIFNIIKNIK